MAVSAAALAAAQAAAAGLPATPGPVKGSRKVAPPVLRARPLARLVATVGNSAMVTYVYVAYLLGVEWHRFGTIGTLSEGQSSSIRDYIMIWDLEPAFDKLSLFTFSEAMLDNLFVYLLIGIPVSVVLLALERDRISWLKGLVAEHLPADQAQRASAHLTAYLVCLGVMLFFIISIAPFHLGFPRMHYMCASAALSFGMMSMLLYISAPVDFSCLAAARGGAATADSARAAEEWSARVQRVVLPVVKAVLALHVVALAAGVLKAEALGDDRLALLFGTLETLLILGYQLFAGVFVFDDIMLSQDRTSLEVVDIKAAADVRGESRSARARGRSASPGASGHRKSNTQAASRAAKSSLSDPLSSMQDALLGS